MAQRSRKSQLLDLSEQLAQIITRMMLDNIVIPLASDFLVLKGQHRLPASFQERTSVWGLGQGLRIRE